MACGISASCWFPRKWNPHPCGYLGPPEHECRCAPRQIETYRQRISGPLLDRSDLHIEVPQVEYRDLKGGATGEASSVIRARVEAAREIQKNRYAGYKGKVVSQTNSALPPKLFEQHCQIDKEGSSMLEQAMNEMHLSARAHDRILKVARTLADLAASETIQSNHVLEAIQFRSLDRRLRW